MSFYDLHKTERDQLVKEITQKLLAELKSGKIKNTICYFEDEDTYIRKTAYQAIGKIFMSKKIPSEQIVGILNTLLKHNNFKVRQTAINAAGEIGKKDFEIVQSVFDTGLFDQHHSPRNAVIGSIKKMSEVNPKPVIKWAKKYLHHPDKEIRREICHGIELRGRKYPEDILPLLKELQHDETSRVRKTLVHVIGQIAYKEGCLKTVLEDLKTWQNKILVKEAIEEIIDVHHRYRDFSAMTQEEAIMYIEKNFKM